MPNATDHQLKRLDHLQSIIQRLGGNAFVIKGWTLTLVSAMLGLALKDGNNPSLAYLSVLPAVAFWALDGYYLATESNARRLYNKAATELATKKYPDQPGELSDPSISLGRLTFSDWLSAIVRPVTSAMYVALIVTALVVGRWALGP